MMPNRERYISPVPAGLDGVDAADAILRSSIRPGDTVRDMPGTGALPILQTARRTVTTFCPHAMATHPSEGGPWIVDIDRRVVGCYDCISDLTMEGTGPLAAAEPLPGNHCAFCDTGGHGIFASFTTRIGRVVIVGNRCETCAGALPS